MNELNTISGVDYRDGTLNELRVRVSDIMSVDNAEVDPQERAVSFSGKLRIEAEDAFEKLKARFQPLGYIPLLRENESGEMQIVVAIKGTLQAVLAQRVWLNGLLFLATFLTTTLFGGMYAMTLSGQTQPMLETILSYGLPFSITLLTILGVHELGHYVQARRHNLPVTLPFFIPVPFGLGTFGAFIQMRGAVENKRALFDVGVGGPVAGLLVAIPLFIVGLLISSVSNSPAPLNRSLMIEGLIAVFRPEATLNGILLNPVLLAARFGLIITAINLLPVGQLDGGHVAYGLLGRSAHHLARGALILLLVAGLTLSPTWLIWGVFVLFGGLHHPPPLNDITGLNRPRQLAGVIASILFFLIVTPMPFR